MPEKKSSLRNRLSITINIAVMIAVILVAVLGCAVTISLYRNLMPQYAVSQIEGCGESLDAWLGEKAAVTEFIGNTIVKMGYADDKEATLRLLIESSEFDGKIYDTYIGYADKTCVFAGGWEPAPGEYDPTSRDWYRDALNADGAVISDPYVDADTGRVVITCSVKLEDNGQVIGVLAQDIFLDDIQEIVNGFRIDEGGGAVLTTAEGDIIVHSDESFLPDAEGNTHNISEVLEGLSADMEGLNTTNDYTGKKVKYGEAEVTATGWRMGYILDDKEYNAQLMSDALMFLIIALVFIGIITIGVNIIIKSLFKPINDMAEKSKEVSRGNLDVSFGYAKNDEIGAVCRVIEDNNRTVKNYIGDISARLEGISHGDFNVKSDVEYIGDYLPIKDALDNISGSLEEVFDGIEGASSAVFNGAGEVSDGASRLSETVANQSALIEEIVTGMKTLSEKIENNVSRTDEARKSAQQAADCVGAGSEQMSRLMDAMKEISDSSEKIQNIISTIEDIAFQTNILALNASVEAARAGAAGKGFAVVADEVRNLAGKSAEASEKTARLIEQSVTAVNNGTKLAAETSASLDEVVSRTNDIDRIIVDINEESHEQSSCVDDLSGKVTTVSGYIESASGNARESAGASEELNGQAVALKNMLDKFKA